MTVRLSFNVAAIRAQTSLSRADAGLAASIERLSSGLRIRRAADAPGDLVIANGMRHHLTGLQTATDNVENGIAMIQTAEGAMNEMSTILLKARELALTAANTASTDLSQRRALQAEMDEIIGSIDRIATTTQFGERRLLDGSVTDSRLSDGRVDPFDNSRAFYTDLIHDDSALVSGVRDDTPISLAAPSSNLIADQLVVRLAGAPPASTAINGVTQQVKVGNAIQNTVLSISGGEAMTISGPLGSQQIRLPDDMSISELITVVNGFRDVTGAELSYDERTGDLAFTTSAPGLGTLRVTSEDMSGGAGVGLFDADVNAINSQGVGINRVQLAVDLLDDRSGGAATNSSLVADLVGNNPGVFDQALSEVDGKHLTLMAGGSSVTVDLSGTSIADIADFVGTNAAATVNYDPDADTLTVTDTLTTTTTVLNIAAATSLDDVMSWVEGQLTDPTLSYAGGSLTIGAESLTPTGTTLGQVIETINLQTNQTGVTASLVAGQLRLDSDRGEVVVQSDDLTSTGEQVGLLDLATLNVAEMGAISNTPTIFAMDMLDEVGAEIPRGDVALRRTLGNGVGFDAIAGTNMVINDGVNPPLTFNLTATTTIDDVVNTINGSAINARASYIDGSLRVIGGAGMTITSDPMNSLIPNHGLWDQNAGTPGDNGASRIDRHPSVDLTYQDGDGISRMVRLFHDPSLNGGYGYRNVTGGPLPIIDQVNGQKRTIFTAYDPAAWQLTLRDTKSDGHSTLVASTTATTARRDSTLVIQTGAEADQTTAINFRDLRADALGHGAGLATDGFRHLQDIVDKQALINDDHNAALSVIDAALEELNVARGEAGAVVANSLEASLDSLRIAVEQLTAAESRIRDTDFAVESAEYARQNILMQAATSMLAQANQVPQSILQLLQ